MTTLRMISSRPAHAALRAFCGVCAVVVLLAVPDAASAQGRLEAHYEATLSGIPVGKGTWAVDIADDRFRRRLPAAPRAC